MKVLWFSVTASSYCSQRNAHNGGGWIESLERIVISHNDINLGIAFISSDNDKLKKTINGVVYYPINIRRGKIDSIRDLYDIKEYDELSVKKYLEVIDDFKPDIIQIFGSEWNFGLIKEYTNIPIIIHVQGFWPEYRNSSFPPGTSKKDYIFERWYKPTSIFRRCLIEKASENRALREEKILRINENFFGRTRWDKAIVKLYNKQARYFYCSEALRTTFSTEVRRWNYKSDSNFTFITIGGGHVLKGYDLVLRTSKLLKDNSGINFKWLLCGPTKGQISLFEKRTNIKCKDVSVFPLGKCSAEELKEKLLNANMYIHTSYIDNSPNSVCEAQYLGLPVIATNVGGTSSLFSDDYPSDMLVPTNDPYYLASKIIELCNDKTKINKMAECNYMVARQRHNDDNIYNSLINAYNNIYYEK